MLGEEEDVFESVAWDTPTAGYETALQGEPSSTPTPRPGFKQSTTESVDERGPHDPKWEGYLITSVRDPVKELAETKDAYVSYLVSAKVDHCFQLYPSNLYVPFTDKSADILHDYTFFSAALPGLRISS